MIDEIGFSKDNQIGFMKQKLIDQFGKQEGILTSSLILIKTCNDCRLALKIFLFLNLLQYHTENKIKCLFAF